MFDSVSLTDMCGERRVLRVPDCGVSLTSTVILSVLDEYACVNALGYCYSLLEKMCLPECIPVIVRNREM